MPFHNIVIYHQYDFETIGIVIVFGLLLLLGFRRSKLPFDPFSRLTIVSTHYLRNLYTTDFEYPLSTYHMMENLGALLIQE